MRVDSGARFTISLPRRADVSDWFRVLHKEHGPDKSSTRYQGQESMVSQGPQSVCWAMSGLEMQSQGVGTAASPANRRLRGDETVLVLLSFCSLANRVRTAVASVVGPLQLGGKRE